MREKFSDPFTIRVDDIKLDVDNFRYYGRISNQRECIIAMLGDPKSKIYELAKDILLNGLTPNPIVLSKNDKNEWVVREGNRRVTALKLLKNPAIIQDDTDRLRFSNMKKKYKKKIPNTIECISCNDENCILDFMDRLHTGERDGTGRIDWSSENKTNFDLHRDKPGKNALAMKVKGWVQKDGVSLKEPYKITNLQRILQNKRVREKLKYDWDGTDITASIDQKILMKILTKIVEKAGIVKVEEVYDATKQLDFVDKIVNDMGINIDDHETDTFVMNPEKPTRAKPRTRKPGGAPTKPSWDRKRLIPYRSTRLSIPDKPGNTKGRNIYRELAKTIDVRQSTNAAAVLFRVFLEMSVNKYIKSNKITVKDDKLKTAIYRSALHMRDNDIISKSYFDEIVRISKDKNLFSARTMQRFVHSFNFSPDNQYLCTLWENIDEFIAKCWK